jgi:hypothetical protein
MLALARIVERRLPELGGEQENGEQPGDHDGGAGAAASHH